jgi:hypothetical protein
MSEMNTTKYRVWWIPQVPMKAFYVPVRTLEQAKLLLDTLAQYDKFQLDHNVKGFYCNTGGLQVLEMLEDGPAWVDWHDPETGDDIDQFSIAECRRLENELVSKGRKGV